MSESTAQKLDAPEDPQSLSDSAQDLGHSIVEGYHELEDTLATTKEQVYDLNRKAVQFIQTHPGACIVGAVALGFVVGRVAKKRWLI